MFLLPTFALLISPITVLLGNLSLMPSEKADGISGPLLRPRQAYHTLQGASMGIAGPAELGQNRDDIPTWFAPFIPA
jgi:hypothetical protein